MKELQETVWFDLFTQGDTVATREFAVVRRRGRPFLFLPTNRRAALIALELYPAQSWKARFAKRLLAFAVRLGRPDLLGIEKYGRAIPTDDAFAQFLSRIAGFKDGALPAFAVLAGNPAAPGRRFVFMLFDAKGNPAAVVKAGINNEACSLIEQETAILKSFSAQHGAVPRMCGEFSSAHSAAFAMNFITGQSPPREATEKLERIFTSWLDMTREVALHNLVTWQRLVAAARSEMSAQLLSLGDVKVHPTLFHGDFAPWNVKVSDDKWTVLDWERGEKSGVPAWDWFHYVVQPAVLVRRESTRQTLARLEALLASSEFQRYTKLAKVAGHERTLLAAYVTYCLRVICQTEGGELLGALLNEVRKAK